MHYKITVSRAVFMSFAVVLLVLISLVCLAPLWHVLMGSLSNPTQVGITQGLILYPLQNLDTHAYSIILTYQRLWNGYLNTFIYIFLQCVLTGVATIVAGYVFSRNRFRFRNTFMLIISSTMLFNGGMIPMYIVMTLSLRHTQILQTATRPLKFCRCTAPLARSRSMQETRSTVFPALCSASIAM